MQSDDEDKPTFGAIPFGYCALRELINVAQEPIASALVKICEQTVELRDIDPGSSETGS